MGGEQPAESADGEGDCPAADREADRDWRSRANHQQRGGRVPDRVTVFVDRARFREGDASADAQCAPSNLDPAAARADGLQEADLDLDRGVADPGRQDTVDGTSKGLVVLRRSYQWLGDFHVRAAMGDRRGPEGRRVWEPGLSLRRAKRRLGGSPPRNRR